MSEKLLDKTEAQKLFNTLKKEYPEVTYYLNFKTPMQLLVCAILSAQTRDEVVNKATPELFKHFNTTKDFANADPEDINQYIKSITFFQTKSSNIIKTCKVIEEKFNGEIPKTMTELTLLPGIGRKTANTILINAFGIVEGIPVDTWVIKLSNRMGLTKNKNPDKIELDLMNLIKKEDWSKAAYIFKAHGKKVCQSSIPLCSACVLKEICPKNNITKSK